MLVGKSRRVGTTALYQSEKVQALTTYGLGDSFSTGDVLLEIETDKAQMEVEAQDEGIMAKIMVIHSLSITYGQQLNLSLTAT